MATLFSGQLPNTQTIIVPALSGPLERIVTVKVANRSASLTETVLFFVQKGAGTPTLDCRMVLAPNEWGYSPPIPLGISDALLGQTSDAATVDYRVVDQAVPLAGITFDSSGLQKMKTVASLGGDLQSQGQANFRNLIDAGDFTTAPFQRGTSQASDIANTQTYGPDRFWLKSGGAGGALDWSQVADAGVPGFGQALKMQRKSGNSDVNVLSIGQTLETKDSVRCQGLPVTLSFWAKQGANYSGGALTVQLEAGTGTDQSAANQLAGSWTNQSHVINTTQAISGTWTRYQFTATVPANATQLGLQMQWTPVGTAGADDSISLQGIQLEIGSSATPFEHRDVEVELALCQRYYFRLTEVNGLNIATGAPTGTNTQGYSFWLPTPMRVAPTLTLTAGGIKLIIDGGAATAITGFAAGTAHSPSVVSLISTNTLSAAAHSILMQGSAGTGLIEASADM